tara:strand:- start:199 stop:909 length:711 start_codon:yes stop_codon:yes gene_type:complete
MAKYTAILIGAAVGAGTSAITGGDPLKGAITGGIGGALGATDFSAIGGSKGGMFDSMGDMIGDVSISGSSGAGSTAGGLFGGITPGQVASTAIGGLGILSSASAQAQQGLNTQAQANFQAQLDTQLGSRKEDESKQAARDYQTARGYDIGTQRSLLGRSGGNPYKGSLLNVQSDYAGEVAYQTAKILNQGQVTSSRLQNQAALTRMAGSSARQAGFQRAGGTVLLGGAQMASNFYY